MTDPEARHGVAQGWGLPSTDYTGNDNGDGDGDGSQDELTDQMGAVARLLAHEHDLNATLDAIVHAAAGTVPGAQEASISVTWGPRVRGSSRCLQSERSSPC